MIESTFKKNLFWLSGCDEVGRGPLAGPVVCACVSVRAEQKIAGDVLDQFLTGSGVNDSKKLTPYKRREILASLKIDYTKTYQKLTYAELDGLTLHFQIQEISPVRIDELNILHASLTGMKEAFENIQIKEKEIYSGAGMVYIDGPYLPKEWRENKQARALVKGDSQSCLIALASILAKEYRDLLMQDLDQKYPGYGLAQHAGYPTLQHREAIARLGVSKIHRKSFKGVREHLKDSLT